MRLSTQLSAVEKLRRGFTVLEALVVLSVIGLVGTVGYFATSTTAKRSAEVKLRADVDSLNRAVQIYVASGGDISTAKDSEDILARLKTKLNDEDARRYIGLTSSMTDVRVKAIYQSPEEAASDQLRTAWDPETQRFILGNAGEAAIKKFIFDDSMAGDESLTEDRTHSTGFMYALNDEWIWDFEDRQESAPTEVTAVSIYFDDYDSETVPPYVPPTEPVEGEDEPGDPGSDTDPNGLPSLTPPVISPEGDKFIFNEFPLAVTLQHYNPAGTCVIRYAIDEGSFQTYSGPFFADHNSTVRAYCASTDKSKYMNSVEVSAFYKSVKQLFAGLSSGDWFGAIQYDGKNNNGHGNNEDGVDSSNEGQGGGGPTGADDPSGEFDDEIKDNGSGSESTGVVSYYHDGTGAVFEWGTSANEQPPNSLRFKGATIINVEPDQLFRIGSLDYFNGTVYSGTEANEVTLNVLMDMTVPDREEVFPITFSLENTTNYGNDPDQDADYVRMQTRVIPMSAELNGVLYYLVVEFGEVTDNGFSSVNQFHVHENKSASTSLYGYFTENPPEGYETYDSQHGESTSGTEGGDTGSTTPTLTVANAMANEGGHLNFSAILSSPVPHDVVVSYSTADGTASSSDNDYTPKSSSVTIPAGQTGRTISIATVDDSVVELDETVVLNYSVSGANVEVSGTAATGTITNTDTAEIFIAGNSVSEGGLLQYSLELSNAVDFDTEITYSTSNGSARYQNGDFVQLVNETLTIPAGTREALITVQTSEDDLVELNETVFLAFAANAAGRSVTRTGVSAAGSIVDTDSADVAIADASVAEGESLRFIVTLSKASDAGTTIQYSTKNGTATTADNDYKPSFNRTLTIPAGDTSGTIWVSTKSDKKLEPDETLNLEYSVKSSGRAIFAPDASATGTIVNNDDGSQGKGHWK